MTRATAPWRDYAGNTIHEGDTIRHPGGTEGRVIFSRRYDGTGDAADEWFVNYADGPAPLSRLVLQIGDKGMAVVVPASANLDLKTGMGAPDTARGGDLLTSLRVLADRLKDATPFESERRDPTPVSTNADFCCVHWELRP